MNERRTSVSSGSPFEPQLGFCRAVREGNIIAISGTAPLSSEGRTVGIGDAAAQARRCLEIVADALERALFAMILGECLKPETDGMDPARYKRPRNGPRMCEQHPKSEGFNGSYNDRDRLGKECVRS